MREIFLLLYYYVHRIYLLFKSTFKVLFYGVVHPQVIFNFLYGVIGEIAEFHRRCGGPTVNFKTSPLYHEMTKKILFSQSNCFNVGFGNVRPVEAQVLGSLVKFLDPKKIFEIGTYNGFSALHLFHNSSPDAVIYTLDLPSDKKGMKLRHDLTEAHKDISTMSRMLDNFIDDDALAQKRIVRLFGDSSSFDFSPYYGSIDFIFIDANHSSEYVKADTENAFNMVSFKGVILWHDHDFLHPSVFQYINQIAKQKKIYYIEKTRYALFINNEDEHIKEFCKK